MTGWTLPLQLKTTVVPGRVPTPDDFWWNGQRAVGVLLLNAHDGKGWMLRSDLATVDCVFDRATVQAVIIPPLPGETGVLNPVYEPGDCRRYGIFPDGATNWEVNYGGRTVAWMSACALAGVTGFMPPGYYASGFNWSSLDYSGARVRMQGVIVGGIFHVQSSAVPASGDPKLRDLRFMGDFSVTDRLGLNNIADVAFDRVRMLSDPARNTSTPGSKGRGAHIYFGCQDVSIDELLVDDCESGNNTDAALAIDGNGDNPQRIRIGQAWIKASDCHGAYVTGFDHVIEELRVDAYAAVGPQRGVQDSDGTAQSLQGCGVWFNRVTGSFGDVIVGQGGGTRANAIYDVRLDETGLNDARELAIDRIILTAVGKGGTNSRAFCIGDREYATGASAQINATIGSILATVEPGATLASGYQIIQINQRAGGTRVKVDRDITILNPGTNQGIRVEAGARFIHGGVTRYFSTGGGTARATALEALGFVRAPLGVEYIHNGGGLDVPAVIWSASAGSLLGQVVCEATTITTKQALRHTASGTQVGPVSSTNLRSAQGTVAVNAGADCTLSLGTIAGGGTVLAGSLGMRLTGAITDFRLIGGKLTGFDIGIGKGTATLTRLSASNLVSTGNTTATNLATTDITQIGACLGVAA
jgi:hypothetical protein